MLIRRIFIKSNSNIKHLRTKDLTPGKTRDLNQEFETRVKLKKLRKSDFHKDYYIA